MEKLLHGQPEAAEEFLVRKKQIDRQGRADLDQNRVFRVADETLDTQILFDFLEKEFDFPALFVDVGDGFGAQPEVIGQKFMAVAAFRVPVTDTPQAQGRFPADDLDNVVGCDAGCAVYRAALQKFVHGVALEAGHEKNALCAKGPEPGIADETFVEHHDRPLGQFQCFGHAAFVGSGVSDGDKGRNMTVMVQQGMHLDAAFCLAERCPGEKRQAKLDGGGVQAEQFGLEAELVFRGFCHAQAVHLGEQILEKAHRPGVVGVGKGGAGHGFQTPMVQAVPGRAQAAQAVAHGTPCGKLDEGHDGELLLEAEFARGASGFVPAFKLLENMSGNER